MDKKDTTWLMKAAATKKDNRPMLEKAHTVSIDGTLYALAADGVRAHYVAIDKPGDILPLPATEAWGTALVYGDDTTTITCDARALLNAYELGRTIGEKDHAVCLRPVANTNTLAVYSRSNAGDVTTTLKVRAVGYQFPADTHINARYMIDALKGFDGLVTIHYHQAYSHIMITDDTRSRIALLQPMSAGVDLPVIAGTVPMRCEDTITEGYRIRRAGCKSSGEVLNPWYAIVAAGEAIPAGDSYAEQCEEYRERMKEQAREAGEAWLKEEAETRALFEKAEREIERGRIASEKAHAIPEPVVVAPEPEPVVVPEPIVVAPAAPACEVRTEGTWTWLHFDDKPDAFIREQLKAQGFRWSVKRVAWYHTGGAIPEFGNIGDAIMREVAERFAVPALPAQCPICLPAWSYMLTEEEAAIVAAAPLTVEEVATLTRQPVTVAAATPDNIIHLADYRKPDPPAPAPAPAPVTDERGRQRDVIGAYYTETTMTDGTLERGYFGAEVAKHIRHALTREYINQAMGEKLTDKFSVTTSQSTGTVSVHVKDRSIDRDEVRIIVAPFQGKHFDGRDDSTNYVRTYLHPVTCEPVDREVSGRIQCTFYAYIFVS